MQHLVEETIKEHHNFCFIIADDPFNIAFSKKKKTNNNDKSKKRSPFSFLPTIVKAMYYEQIENSNPKFYHC